MSTFTNIYVADPIMMAAALSFTRKDSAVKLTHLNIIPEWGEPNNL